MGAQARARQAGAKVGRALTIGLLVAIGVFVVWHRCSQMSDHANDMLEAGLNEWADALEGSGDMDRARAYLEEAAGHSLDADYALFCLSAIDEVSGNWQYEIAPSEAWDAAVGALIQGELTLAEQRFQEIGGEAARAHQYIQLIDDLAERIE